MLPPLKLEGYAIYNPITQMWSKGGTGPKWNKKPKIWSTVGNLKNHLNQMVYASTRYDWIPNSTTAINIRSVYDGCVIWDVVANSEWLGPTIDQIYESYIERCYRSRHYYKGHPVRKVR